MTFDDFKATVRARFPTIDFRFSAESLTFFRADHERASVRRYPNSGDESGSTWRFSVSRADHDFGPTLDAAIDAHQLRLQLITTNAQAMGLL